MMKDAYTKVRNMGYLLHSVDFVPLTALPGHLPFLEGDNCPRQSVAPVYLDPETASVVQLLAQND
jgi:hypothetical protein